MNEQFQTAVLRTTGWLVVHADTEAEVYAKMEVFLDSTPGTRAITRTTQCVCIPNTHWIGRLLWGRDLPVRRAS